jgi:N-acetylmuramoyl-L-alanine amidase
MKFLPYIVFFIPLTALCAGPHANITKLFQHEGVFGDKVVCYVDGDPICNRLPQHPADGNVAKEVFFLPMASLRGEAQSMATKMSGVQNGKYRVSVEEVQHPIKGVKITFMFDPSRVSIDYAGFDAISRVKGIVFSVHDKEKLQDITMRTAPILKLAMGKKKPTIIVDPGHGGNDHGKVGCFGVKEKALTLAMCRQLARRLEGYGYSVSLTRDADRFVALDHRTSMANKLKGDLFISLHANAGPSKTVGGLETYCIKPDLFTYPDSCLHPSSLAVNRSREVSLQSSLLAQSVHSNLLGHAKPLYPLKDRSIRHSVAQVLLGAEMPSILVELGFLSNPVETKQLIKSEYQNALVEGICSGINAYFKKAV